MLQTDQGLSTSHDLHKLQAEKTANGSEASHGKRDSQVFYDAVDIARVPVMVVNVQRIIYGNTKDHRARA